MQYLSKEQAEKLISCARHNRQRCLLLLLIDCGLRVSELCTLQLKNFDFKNRILVVKSLKKRTDNVKREIPISNRLFDALASYLSEFKTTNPSDYLFFSPTDHTKPITRFAVNKYLLRVTFRNNLERVHPHTLRHTFATHLVASDAPLHNVRALLGHKSYDTTLIYAHTPIEQLRANIDRVTEKKKSPLVLLLQRLRPKPKKYINLNFNSITTVGRNTEIATIQNNAKSHINTILLGSIGVGKTHLLRAFADSYEGKMLELDDLDGLKKSLGNMLLYLYQNDKEQVASMVFGEFDLSKQRTRLTRESVANLCDEVMKVTQQHEYILLIHKVDAITPKTAFFLEKLKDHFTIITSARSVPLDRASFLWNFDTIRLNNLPRQDALRLAQQSCAGLEVESSFALFNHIWEQSNGNPRAITELADRYRKEPILDLGTIKSIKHTGALPEIDMSIWVIVLFAGLASLKFLTNETGNSAYRAIGGVALMFMLLSRTFFGFTKRKLV